MKPITSEIMAEIDRKAQEDFGIPQSVLMENAGRSAAETILQDLNLITDEKIAIFCGKGNNGGDGFVVARYLAERSPDRLTVFVKDPSEIKEGCAKDNFRIIQDMGIEVEGLAFFMKDEDASGGYTVGIDSIFGTGFRGDLPEEYARLGDKINSSGMKIYAIDVPSGLDATSGAASESCIKAYKTITFGLPKQGFFVEGGPGVCGEVEIKDIGFPEELLKPYMD